MHVAITGASSGIGAALARAYAKAGAHLTLVARRRELLDQLASDIGTRTHQASKDLTDPTLACELRRSGVNGADRVSVLGCVGALVPRGNALVARSILAAARADYSAGPLIIEPVRCNGG